MKKKTKNRQKKGRMTERKTKRVIRIRIIGRRMIIIEMGRRKEEQRQDKEKRKRRETMATMKMKEEKR